MTKRITETTNEKTTEQEILTRIESVREEMRNAIRRVRYAAADLDTRGMR